MTIPRLLIDNDIFILLAGAGLLEQAVITLGFTIADTYRLEALPFVVKRSKQQPHLPPDLVAHVVQECHQVPVLAESPNPDLLQLLVTTPLIDAGEAVLYALLAEYPNYFLTSGDKRAMRTIAQQPRLAPIYTAVAGRVICLETLLLALVKQRGVTTIGRALTPLQPFNKVLQVAFSDQCLAQPDECLQALTQYQQTLMSEVGARFLWQYSA